MWLCLQPAVASCVEGLGNGFGAADINAIAFTSYRCALSYAFAEGRYLIEDRLQNKKLFEIGESAERLQHINTSKHTEFAAPQARSH